MKYIKLKFISKIVILLSLLILSQQVLAQTWQPVAGSILAGISGMAIVHQQDNALAFLVVHDNKKPDQPRLGIVTVDGKKQPKYTQLNWPSNTQLPADLESITSIPGRKNNFIAVASAGKAYHIKLDPTNQTTSLVQEFELPEIKKSSNFEAFASQNINNQLVALWAHRGEGKEPAIIYWGLLDLDKYQIKHVSSANFIVPFPSGNVRHISDIKIDSAGIVYVSSASDGGDDGPFESAIYAIGDIDYQNNKIIWRQNSQLFPLQRFNYHKIEALELVRGADGGVIVGTDDENFGSAVYMLGDNN